jgi:ABC-type transport system involved in cytochrome c biogenesis permease subunit
MPLDHITIFCFAASYACALALELIQLFGPKTVPRVLSLAFSGAGLLAHTLFLLVNPQSLSTQSGSMLFLAWILAVFYLYSSVHYHRLTWGVFVLPLVLGLTVLAAVAPSASNPDPAWLLDPDWLRGERFWGMIHGTLLLLAAVGVCVGFLASLMYLIQARRLRAKVPPGTGLRLLSLERLELMNRRAIVLAFPLLTAGVLVGIALLIQQPASAIRIEWTDPKILSTALLWLVFAIVLYLRYGYHLRGKRVAQLMIVAFGLMLFTLALGHAPVPGGGP